MKCIFLFVSHCGIVIFFSLLLFVYARMRLARVCLFPTVACYPTHTHHTLSTPPFLSLV